MPKTANCDKNNKAYCSHHELTICWAQPNYQLLLIHLNTLTQHMQFILKAVKICSYIEGRSLTGVTVVWFIRQNSCKVIFFHQRKCTVRNTQSANLMPDNTRLSVHFSPNQMKVRAQPLLLFDMVVSLLSLKWLFQFWTGIFCNRTLSNVKWLFVLWNSARILL